VKTQIESPNTTVLDRFETAAGNEIPNYQNHSLIDYGSTAARLETYGRLYRGAIPRTKTPTGVYNCHGFVFASGRTGIDAGKDVRMILNDDGFVKIAPEQSLPGDVVLYVADDGDVEHSAVLVTPARDSLSRWPVVVSKWGNFTEYVHDLHLCPYNAMSVEYWRIEERPRIPQPARPQCLIQI
jgi:hypothetical protein